MQVRFSGGQYARRCLPVACKLLCRPLTPAEGGGQHRSTAAEDSFSASTGGGAIQLIIPQVYDSLAKHHPDFVAWR